MDRSKQREVRREQYDRAVIGMGSEWPPLSTSREILREQGTALAGRRLAVRTVGFGCICALP